MALEYQTLNDGCDGDSSGLASALEAGGALLLHEERGDYGYGHHSYNAIFFLVKENRYVHAECGGCSCNGSGSWSYAATLDEALRLVPDTDRGAFNAAK